MAAIRAVGSNENSLELHPVVHLDRLVALIAIALFMSALYLNQIVRNGIASGEVLDDHIGSQLPRLCLISPSTLK
jgi:hypothetical protein